MDDERRRFFRGLANDWWKALLIFTGATVFIGIVAYVRSSLGAP